jgi:hypothetical protein
MTDNGTSQRIDEALQSAWLLAAAARVFGREDMTTTPSTPRRDESSTRQHSH